MRDSVQGVAICPNILENNTDRNPCFHRLRAVARFTFCMVSHRLWAGVEQEIAFFKDDCSRAFGPKRGCMQSIDAVFSIRIESASTHSILGEN